MDLSKRSSYHFHLPEELVAAYPLKERADARLLVVRRSVKTIEHHFVKDLPNLLPPQAMVVANNTKVVRARLLGTRLGTDGKVEFFILKKVGDHTWEGLIRSHAKVGAGFQFQVGPQKGAFVGEVLARNETTAGAIFTVRFNHDPLAAGMGEVPLPPYLVAKRGKTTQKPDDELEIYNTVFAKHDGSVAAPTAGRHFTEELVKDLIAQGFSWEEITLHVGLGTFKPVTTDDVREHTMHGEMSLITPAVADRIAQAKNSGRKIISIGTTSTRTLEGRTHLNSARQVELSSGEEEIKLFIHPESKHEWKMVDGILTNFHLPESTLLMMIASFIGDLAWVKTIYETAIRERYRFYSYGDAMLIL